MIFRSGENPGPDAFEPTGRPILSAGLRRLDERLTLNGDGRVYGAWILDCALDNETDEHNRPDHGHL